MGQLCRVSESTVGIVPLRILMHLDTFSRITIPASLLLTANAPDAVDYATPLAYHLASISATLRRALGSRARAFQLTAPTPSIISATDKVSSKRVQQPVVLSLGILINAGEAGRLVDQGPSAEDEAACEEFRTFWGEKSELRRFKDGAILESVVWETPTTNGLGQQRNKVVSQVVKYILQSRHSIAEEDVEIFAGAMDHLIVEPEGLRRAIYLEDSVASSKGFGNIMAAYDSLVKELTGLDELPLSIASVAPSSAGLRYSTIFTPSPRRLKEFERFPTSIKFIEAHDLILTMEGSGRWPDDLEGVQKIKSAFLAKIGERLESLSTIISAQVVFDLSTRSIDDNVSLEILTVSGYAFRARILYERSVLLIKNRAMKLGLAVGEDLSMIHYNERFIHSPRHHAAITTLQHHFTSYSPTIRLTKRWFSSHMLSNYFPPQVLELLVASIFLDATSPHEPPSSGPTGFARVMDKLVEWKWREEPLLVPLYTFSTSTTSGRRADFPSAKAALSRGAFNQRKNDGGSDDERGAWCIATEEDVEGIVWGKKIGKVVAGRVRGLAKATLHALNQGVLQGDLIVEVSQF
jgi:U3 small nucleolar RNA-associated protein 22